MRYILDDKGKPALCDDLIEWAEWMERNDRRVDHTMVGEVRVSTVFLGLDHSFLGGAPILYETMVFGGPEDLFQVRYYDREEAEAGHKSVVARVRRASEAK